ncbi:MAG: hypothetical protein IT428_12000 [Planctomycetaceae bacterium]|nr:hypothetical protein [Planctomycetaceae bacterium]
MPQIWKSVEWGIGGATGGGNGLWSDLGQSRVIVVATIQDQKSGPTAAADQRKSERIAMTCPFAGKSLVALKSDGRSISAAEKSSWLTQRIFLKRFSRSSV